ncbi:glycerate dehydrogenase [Coraliomargarita sinensis]|uniref:Glycerate dehydrogenase n=1 Tax=Coraliomargarita sinensis TaxID=2174842 RepID=A0A317ZFA1_9BACT|nr:D-2-hydroxyacid dehydrogenase [Coraliomargarita sinensis]PXA03037.1 glycerate dehydrogenase [Coraliomargarita sinensis]
MKIVVLDGFTLNPGDNPWDGVEKLGEFSVYDRTPADKIVERCAGADIVLTNKTPLTAETLAQLPDLKFISVLATGFNVIDVAAARKQDIPVANVPIYGTDSVGQFVFALLLELCHNAALHGNLVKEGAWSSNPDFCFWKTPLVELSGKTMGIVGLGRIGRRTVALASAFGMKVIACTRTRKDAPDLDGFEWVELEELFEKSDVVSLHCPQTADNVGFVNAALLKKMKPSSFLINTSRGPLIVEEDLAEALDTGILAGAGLDVASVEPIKADNPLLKAKNCLITPHIAWATLEARQRLMQTTVDNVAGFIDGSPINVVN